MITMIAKKRELRVRRTILKGVYEDNLRIIGKLQHIISEKSPFYRNKLVLTFFMSLIAVLIHGNPVSGPSSPNEQITAGFSSPKYNVQYTASSSKPFEYMAFVSNHEIPLSRMFGLDVKTIMIDPGHGGTDPGTMGKMGTEEKVITLDIAKRLKRRLQRFGHYNVLMTRENDISVPLNKRVELANVAKTDLFISIHLNYLPSKPINIIETYYFGPSFDTNVLRLAEKENEGSQYRLSDFKDMIEKIGNTLKLQESKEFALSIQKSLFLNTKKQNGKVYDFGVKKAPFVVLLGVDVPAVLAEVSCLSNSEEEMKLNTESHRENIARYLEAGILDYLNKGEVHYEAKKH
jgi:N-acetylmuramoyl-L-alanine amidase